jgi:hypothetical protein
MSRIYTASDDQIERALDAAVEQGLTDSTASRSARLRALALYAGDRLTEEHEREERRAAYKRLAEDEERLVAIRESVLVAAEDGIL